MHIVFLPVRSPDGVSVNYSCYRTSPQPKLAGPSTALKPTPEELAEFRAEVAATLSPELAAVVAVSAPEGFRLSCLGEKGAGNYKLLPRETFLEFSVEMAIHALPSADGGHGSEHPHVSDH